MKHTTNLFAIKSVYIVVLGTVILGISCRSYQEAKTPSIDLPDLSKVDTEIRVMDWRLIGPFISQSESQSFLDTDRLELWNLEEVSVNEENLSSLALGTAHLAPGDSTLFKNINYSQDKYHVDLADIFKTGQVANCYAFCDVYSPIDQDGALMLGSDDGIKVWLNHKLCLRANGRRYLQRNRDVVSVHLNKGKNFLLLKINNQLGGWGFYLNISSLKYAKPFYLSAFAPNFLEDCLLRNPDTLYVTTDALFFRTSDSLRLDLLGGAGQSVMSTTLVPGYDRSIPINNVKDGVYSCRLIAGWDTIMEKMVVGNYKAIFAGFERSLRNYQSTVKSRIDIETLLTRFTYLDSFGIRNGYDKSLKQKLAITLFELSSILERAKSGADLFADLPGWHLRGYVSKIDNTQEQYMVYIPSTYRKDRLVPLVIIMPWVSSGHMQFMEGPHVSYLDKIEIATYWAEKNGYALLWPESRIYNRYNLNPISTTSTFEAIDEVLRDYHIDEKRLYLYGNCSGGLFALLLANRYPSRFAAIGVEGPELSYAGPNNTTKIPSQWVEDNNILHFPDNYRYIPIYIGQSPQDEKADFDISCQLAQLVRNEGGRVILDTMAGAKSTTFDLFPEEEAMRDIFSFFQAKTVHPVDSIEYSTTQLKYDRAYWITIDRLVQFHKKASINAFTGTDNSITVNTVNISRYTIDLSGVPSVNAHNKLTVKTNGDIVYSGIPVGNTLQIRLDKDTVSGKRMKNSQTEGPINDFFKDRFIAVQGTAGTSSEISANKAAIDSFVGNWKDEYYGDCRVKGDKNITPDDIRNYNFILFGNQYQNDLVASLVRLSPLRVDREAITIGEKKYVGKDLGYCLIYPNPRQPGKYILLIGSNSSNLSNIYKYLPYKGWFDFEVKQLATGKLLAEGYFDSLWGLK